MPDIGRWVSLGVILFIMLVSLIVELAVPSSFGTTTIVSFIPAAFIAGFLEFQWWLPIVEIGSAIVIWISICWLMLKIFRINSKKNKRSVDYTDQLKTIETVLLKNTSNYNGRNEFGEIKVDDKKYLVLPADDQVWIESNSVVRVVFIKGNVCYVRKVNY